ncbi:MAG TPA: hypothetical protein PKG54_03405 [Phycisphaerae bacterium]|jgi:hypothetical protein|nr:hypothetical protein [Phycisphaerae bacterium]HOB73552.1 hypothetical protein [Phycisphaerae bacterium]HOJ54160.1 hypothetical protein [Phycisphaerae bacterium]HOL25547.1 hypothetical protein [Phycisphaerae bacterium]HPP21020.1 hypothetical protein [Phycisphaerae bacterium]
MSPRTYAGLLAMLAVAAVGFVYWRAWLCDDAYITFRHVANCLGGNGPVFNVGERVQGYTHPLWLLLLLGPTLLIGPGATAIAAGLISAAAILLIVGLYLKRDADAARRWPVLLIGAVALLGSHTFVEFQTSGLETPLTSLLIVAFWTWLFRHSRQGTIPAGRTVLGCSLLILTRPDHALLCLPLLIWLVAGLWTRREGRAFLRLLAGFVPVVLWGGFATIYYGTPFPNTAYAKLALPAGVAWTKGALYLWDYAQWEPVHAVLIVAVLAVELRDAVRSFWWHVPERAVPACLALGLVLTLLYVTAIGGDCMRGRMLLPAVVGAVVLGVRRLAQSQSQKLFTLSATAVMAAGLLLAVCVATGRFWPWKGFWTGWAMLRGRAGDVPALTIAIPAVYAFVVMMGMRSLELKTSSRRGSRLFEALAVLHIYLFVAVIGSFDPPWAILLVMTTCVLTGAYLCGLTLCGGQVRRPWAQGLLGVLIAAMLSLCDVQLRRTPIIVGDIWDTYAWHRTRWYDNRFAETSAGLHPTVQEWIWLGVQAGRYADRFGPISMYAETMGYLPYCAGPGVHVIDMLGLTDAFVARLPARPDSRVGHIRHDVPLAYLRSKGAINLLPDWRERLEKLDPTLREEAQAMMRDPGWEDEAAYQKWQAIQQMISGELLSPERVRMIPRYALKQGL